MRNKIETCSTTPRVNAREYFPLTFTWCWRCKTKLLVILTNPTRTLGAGIWGRWLIYPFGSRIDVARACRRFLSILSVYSGRVLTWLFYWLFYTQLFNFPFIIFSSAPKLINRFICSSFHHLLIYNLHTWKYQTYTQSCNQIFKESISSAVLIFKIKLQSTG